MREKKVGVYQIRNIVTGKIYIGSSIDIDTRWAEHKRDLRVGEHRNKRLQNSYNKHGEANFVYEVLELTNKDNIYNREQYWIDTTNAWKREVGYNIQRVVLIPPTTTKKVVCLDTREIFDSITEASEKYGISSGSISCCCHKRKLKQTGGLHWRFYTEYVDMSEEEITKVLFDVTSYPFICLDDGRIYRSWRELPYKKGLITRCCNKLAQGKYATCDNKKYMFLKDYNKLNDQEVQKIKDLARGAIDAREVICIENKKVYDCARVATSNVGTSSKQILHACKTRAKAGGVHWLFKDDYDKLSPSEVQDILNPQRRKKCTKAVVCLETKKKYNSGVEASKDTGVSTFMISKICINKGVNTSTGVLHFMFLQDYEKCKGEDIARILTQVSPKIRPVQCIETGVTYTSVSDAANAFNAQTTNISKCCRNSQYTCKGYHWRYI